jgi:hypothetical protein
MNQIVVDAEMEKQIGTATVQVVNSKGTVIGVVTPVKFPHSPYTREEIERRREEAKKHPELTKTTAEVLAELRRRVGENR